MELVYAIIVLVTGGWLITISFIMNTRNVTSSIIFKVIPFFLGAACLFVGAKMIGLI